MYMYGLKMIIYMMDHLIVKSAAIVDAQMACCVVG
jgi:hypothetical protein